MIVAAKLCTCALLLFQFAGWPSERNLVNRSGPPAARCPSHCSGRHASSAVLDGSPIAASGKESSSLEVAENLEDCSPFYNFDGGQELEFDTQKGTVTETHKALAQTSPADTQGPAVKIVGDFAVAQSNRVETKLGGVMLEYTLVIPTDGDQCILAVGAATSVDLEQSWFGDVDQGPEPPDAGNGASST
jgi:hypothetical protein